jgi:hypothetical protein
MSWVGISSFTGFGTHFVYGLCMFFCFLPRFKQQVFGNILTTPQWFAFVTSKQEDQAMLHVNIT